MHKRQKQTHTELPVFTDLPDHILPILSKEPTIQVHFIINGLATSYKAWNPEKQALFSYINREIVNEPFEDFLSLLLWDVDTQISERLHDLLRIDVT